MMLMPCNTCRLKETCELRAEKRRMLRGTKLTSARFDCQAQRDDMPPGAVVDAKLPYVWHGQVHYGGREEVDYAITDSAVLRGIVMRWYRGKVLVYFPEQEAGSLWTSKDHGAKSANSNVAPMAKLTPNYLAPTGERETVCVHCGLPKVAKQDERIEWVCRNKLDGDYGPPECVYNAPIPAEVLPW